MTASAIVREQIESALAMRIPAALSMRPRSSPELAPTGIEEVDALLDGGLPVGSVAEVIGPACSGRSTLVLSALAGVTSQGAAAAYVDVSDAFDPLSAAAMGIDLGRLLWVRVGGAGETALNGPRVRPQGPSGGKAPSRQSVRYGCGGSHPRTEIRGMEYAVERLFQSRTKTGGEVPAVDFSPRCAEPVRGRRASQFPADRQSAEFPRRSPQPAEIAAFPTSARNSAAKGIWNFLDRALRATDLLLNTGGFRAIVVDMGDIGAEQARRVPLALWYRFRLQAEKAQAILILVAQTACAGSCASVILHCMEADERWQSADESAIGVPLLTGFRYTVDANRRRGSMPELVDPFKKKPVSVPGTFWSGTTLWAR